jgi:hypothetical protein
MEQREKRNNLGSLLGVEKIPGADHIRNVLDGIELGGLYGAFGLALEVARQEGVLESYRVLNGTIAVALDGTWYFSSKEIHCDHCLTIEQKTRKGETHTLYYHDRGAATVVKPGKPEVVLPLIPEFIRNEDGKEKQDGERNAALKLTLWGDDRYCCHQICTELLEAGMSYLLTCKEESHPWIAEQVR